MTENNLYTRPGAAIYSSLVLKVYDAWVLGFSNRFAWRCPTGTVLLPFYRRHLGGRHLDVGVGTGYYLAHADLSAVRQLALLDLNDNSLRAAAARSGRADVASFQGDVMQPLDIMRGQQYDSIALFYLLHCLPGTMATKEAVFRHLKSLLSPDGVVYGATILGTAAGHNGVGRYLMNLYNRKGIFGNRDDSVDSLRQALSSQFEEVTITRHGMVALFTARRARKRVTD
ncbi:methyltransferase [Duganella callida]|uniref:Class I SAM-dependent methyltransferase n=1 Tax=Duganella callida TaxID=2561932 RepID=A0A4Y9SHS5_9BURK|nr:class I SAM-dependent methyltransferase [Duganella callida]TFW23859.1 class I SAM-dependent methyltransferase [Duganella callida]